MLIKPWKTTLHQYSQTRQYQSPSRVHIHLKLCYNQINATMQHLWFFGNVGMKTSIFQLKSNISFFHLPFNYTYFQQLLFLPRYELTSQQRRKHQLQLQSTLSIKFSYLSSKIWKKLARLNLLWNDLNEMRIYINLLMSEKINFTS